MKPRGTVGYLISNHQVLLAQIRYPDNQLFWNGIGGFIESNENPIEAVAREFQEETGLILSKSKARVATIVNLPGIDLYIILANGASGQAKPQEPSIVQLAWFDISRIPYLQMHPGNQAWLEPLLTEALA